MHSSHFKTLHFAQVGNSIGQIVEIPSMESMESHARDYKFEIPETYISGQKAVLIWSEYINPQAWDANNPLEKEWMYEGCIVGGNFYDSDQLSQVFVLATDRPQGKLYPDDLDGRRVIRYMKKNEHIDVVTAIVNVFIKEEINK